MEATYIICAAVAFLSFLIIAVNRIFFKKKPVELELSADTSDLNDKLGTYIDKIHKISELVDRLNKAESTIDELNNQLQIESNTNKELSSDLQKAFDWIIQGQKKQFLKDGTYIKVPFFSTHITHPEGYDFEVSNPIDTQDQWGQKEYEHYKLKL